MIHVFYRISDAGYAKVKPSYISNRSCLENFLQNFGLDVAAGDRIHFIADNVQDETFAWLSSVAKQDGASLERTSYGNGARSFNRALDLALALPDGNAAYMLENDYLHLPRSREVLHEGLLLGADYVSLYDHPDKYIDAKSGGNPFVEGGGEFTKVFLTKSCHWKVTNSTTMTFAARVSTLKADEAVLRKWTEGTHPHDFQLFMELAQQQKRILITPIPAFSTHGETKWLSPLVDWETVATAGR